MRKIDDIEYTVEISCYFLTKWHEDRLVLHEDILREKFEEESEVGGEGEEQWYPIDLEFVSKVCNGDVQKVLYPHIKVNATNVVAYLTPHPLDHDLLSLGHILGFSTGTVYLTKSRNGP